MRGFTKPQLAEMLILHQTNASRLLEERSEARGKVHRIEMDAKSHAVEIEGEKRLVEQGKRGVMRLLNAVERLRKAEADLGDVTREKIAAEVRLEAVCGDLELSVCEDPFFRNAAFGDRKGQVG